ncbi:MAG TPA: radical SAM family heme chaperone HemW, partial [Candidatus Cloacimonadota bacterium]|nr:radical SAM family heme chaperone HemW [Candidatus Cloacimonadota bacterium]
PVRPLGLYIHIPWCLSQCGYCDFFSLPFSRTALDEYTSYLSREKALYSELQESRLSTVYFGGGTPSLLSRKQINIILDGLSLTPDAEITLEINPLQITESYVEELQTTAVNRLSLGVQSMHDDELVWLTRRHKAESLKPRLKLLVERGYTNLSADLIYGLPRGNVDRLRQNLDKYLELPLQHISCYLLELHENSVLATQASLLPDEEVQADMYGIICNFLQENGFEQYEISNFCRPGQASRHNLLYWHCDDCLALGASACGNYHGIRYANPADLQKYYQNVDTGIRFPDSDEGANVVQDYIMMNLRLREGLSLQEYSRRFGGDFRSGREQSIARLVDLGLLEVDADRIRLSPEALFISNHVIGELL